jgi:superfamily II DNA/RNA helicase
MIDELATRIWNRDAFQEEYRRLIQESLSQSVRINQANTPLDRSTLRRLLQSATHFAASSHSEYREAAYRIATSAWQLFSNEYDNLNEIALVILTRLGNFPAANYLYRDQNENKGSRLPQALWFELAAHEAGNTIEIGERVEILTDFQKRLWDILSSGVSVAVTAPTSAGKSFALQRYLISTLIRNAGWALYIVPTRTLINQISASILRLIKELNSDNLAVSTIPITPHELDKSSGVYILTQERLQMLLEAENHINFQLVIIDEAQMVSEDARGVILQSVIERVHSITPDIQFLFGSPQTHNPEIFRDLFDLENAELVTERESPVAQNLIFIDRVSRHPREVVISAYIGSERSTLGRLEFEQALRGNDDTFAYLSWIFGRNEKSLVYAGGPARCEKLANKLVQLAQTQREKVSEAPPIDPALVDFSAFIKEHVHPEYFLAESILYGVAFHYGNMPAIIRKTVEEFFDEGRLTYLVCTSTLLHGVNLPAKNLFLFNPTKGRDQETRKDTPLTTLDFWNLAGRAGRLGKDFEGNVFLVELSKWKSQPLEGEKYQEVKPALITTIVDRSSKFLEFIQNQENPSGGKQQAIENAFVKIFNDYRRGQLSRTLDKTIGTEQSELRASIESAVQEVAASISVPTSITERNINVSVFRQQEMLDYLTHKISTEGPERFIPVHPSQPWDDACDNLKRLFKRIHSHFEKKPGQDRTEFFFAPLALRWMRGEPLARLIDDAYRYKQESESGSVQIANVIRDVMAKIEQDLRFRYVKYTNCYNDLLKEALKQTGHEELIESIPPISLFLEIGASSYTMINLVGLGLSRTAASIIAARADNENMSMPEVEEWLSSHNWEAISVSSIILREIRRVLR